MVYINVKHLCNVLVNVFLFMSYIHVSSSSDDVYDVEDDSDDDDDDDDDDEHVFAAHLKTHAGQDTGWGM